MPLGVLTPWWGSFLDVSLLPQPNGLRIADSLSPGPLSGMRREDGKCRKVRGSCTLKDTCAIGSDLPLSARQGLMLGL